MSETNPTPEATETPAPAEAEAPKVDHTAVLTEAFMGVATGVEAGVSTLTDEQVTALQEAYRSVPSAARATAQGNAMQAVIEQAQRADLLPAILTALNNMPKATKSRTAKPALDPAVAAAVEGAALIQAFHSLKEANPEAATTASAWMKDGIPDEHKEAVAQRAAKAVAAVQKSTRGGSGDRSSYSQSLKDLVESGAVPKGSKLTCAVDGIVANVRQDGTVSVKLGDELKEFDNLSGAAKAVKEHSGAKNASVNGWDFFQITIDGKTQPVGKLRTA